MEAFSFGFGEAELNEHRHSQVKDWLMTSHQKQREEPQFWECLEKPEIATDCFFKSLGYLLNSLAFRTSLPAQCFRRLDPSVCSGHLPESCELGYHPALGDFQDPFNPSLTHMPPVMTICNPVPARKDDLYPWEFREHLGFVPPGPEPISLY